MVKPLFLLRKKFIEKTLEKVMHVPRGQKNHKKNQKNEPDHINHRFNPNRNPRTSNFFNKYHKKSPSVERRKRNEVYNGEVQGNYTQKLDKILPSNAAGLLRNRENPYWANNSQKKRPMEQQISYEFIKRSKCHAANHERIFKAAPHCGEKSLPLGSRISKKYAESALVFRSFNPRNGRDRNVRASAYNLERYRLPTILVYKTDKAL